MYINCHAHVFNFRSVFTEKSVGILLQRIRRGDLPEWFKEAVTDFLRRLIVEGRGPGLPEVDVLLADLAARLATRKRTPAVAVRLAAVPALAPLAARMDTWLAQLPESLTALSADPHRQSVLDLIEFLRIGLLPGIRDVARVLMDQLQPDEAAVALTMDITRGPDDAETDPFPKQLRDTSALIRAYPGRLFPFVAANPLRPDFLAQVRRAVSRLGFVGVKLYPSLDDRYDWAAADTLFAWCERHGVPVMVHCNDSGFSPDAYASGQGDPDKWRVILGHHPGLRICFGHFGGGENFTASEWPGAHWTRIILDLMREHPGVYADVSFHVHAMDGGAGERRYFARLKDILADPETSGRVLFGTDFFLMRQRATERACWAYYRKHLGPERFATIATANPERYLGLRGPDGLPEANIRRHLGFLARHAARLAAMPAPWVMQAFADIGEPTPPFAIRTPRRAATVPPA